MKRIEILEPAADDLGKAVVYYNQAQENLGFEFLDEFKRTVARIIAFPDAWPSLSKRTRRCQTNRFPYGVIYKLFPDKLVIVSVMHLHSEPGKWKRRRVR